LERITSESTERHSCDAGAVAVLEGDAGEIEAMALATRAQPFSETISVTGSSATAATSEREAGRRRQDQRPPRVAMLGGVGLDLAITSRRSSVSLPSSFSSPPSRRAAWPVPARS
jgi:hypothetical protein